MQPLLGGLHKNMPKGVRMDAQNDGTARHTRNSRLVVFMLSVCVYVCFFVVFTASIDSGS